MYIQNGCQQVLLCHLAIKYVVDWVCFGETDWIFITSQIL